MNGPTDSTYSLHTESEPPTPPRPTQGRPIQEPPSSEGAAVDAPVAPPSAERLVSLDAYRGFIMLAMASGGFAFARVADNTDVMTQFDGTTYGVWWDSIWRFLGYQFSHVEWVGCGFWDLIQPSFMFMVGVAMPYSFSRRRHDGQSGVRLFGHVLFRSLVLVLLGVFLSSNWSGQTNFTFVNVLTQIGLGYPVLYLLLNRRRSVQLLALAAILGGYWYFFYQYNIPDAEAREIAQYLEQVADRQEPAETRFDGLASHWNKHTNAAAAVDRVLLNWFPRDGESWNGQKFWINNGGYQTLNFIPSIATMLLGLIAGQVLRGPQSKREKFEKLFLGGVACLLIGLAADTHIWPTRLAGANWTICPTVKRIWTPTWAVFSAGWTFWMLAGFYWIIDIKGWKAWAFPLKVVGMNSIAMYCMAQLIRPWIGKTLQIHLTTIDVAWNLEKGFTYYLFSPDFAYSAVLLAVSQLFVLWLFCLWLYRKRIFIRI